MNPVKQSDSPIPTPAITEELLQELRRLLEAATPGPWTADSVGHRSGHGDMLQDLACGPDGRSLFDTFNADTRTILGETDEDGTYYRDDVGAANIALVVALRNAAPRLLAAAARLKETKARCEALRKICIAHDPDIGKAGVDWCRACEREWDCGNPEEHLDGCPARPLPESQR